MTMPFYRCITLVGMLAQEQKEEIVREITRIHCEATGALPRFVQILFEEVRPGDVFQNGKPSQPCVFTAGSVRVATQTRSTACWTLTPI
jgi:phenylpyruvate tautomerase PptA (4-oxalocrotonate tautomerase family)